MTNEYLKQIQEKYKTKDYLEHTYRTPFENFLNRFIKEVLKEKYIVIHEPQRESGLGAPDFKIIDSIKNRIGYIECKNITNDLSKEKHSPQLQKYLAVEPNLILTNYIDFVLYKNKVIVKEFSITSLAKLDSKSLVVDNENVLTESLKQFLLSTPEKIKDSRKLSEELAERTRILKDLLLVELSKKEDNPFTKFYDIFQKTIISDLTIKSFADMYAQIIGIGLLFLRLSKNEDISKDNVISKIPKYIPLLRDFFPNTSFDEWSPDIVWILDEIILLINSMDKDFIKKNLSYKDLSIIKKRDSNLKDPFINFYEIFLTVYDKKLKDERGVFYTPESAASFIIRSLDIILTKIIKVKDGYLDDKLKILDFASGTGTFILALIDYINIKLIESGKKTLFDSEIREHILKNVYGFELLVVPYIISHLRIHEYLESKGFIYSNDSKERAEIFLTNTLINTKAGKTNFFKHMDDEADLAEIAKNKTEIMVIMGNPPYSNFSQNKAKDEKGNNTWIGELIEDYKPKGERKINLDDDYIKFIRFACWKLETIEKGVIGIITNNSFLNGITHRKMRKVLLDSFDEIYILNLHGNGNIGETSPDGSADNNIFSIKDAGISINFFIKTNKQTNKQTKLFYYDLYGKQNDKYNFLYSNDITTINFEEVDYNKFNEEFSKTLWGNTISDVGKKDIKLYDDGLNFFIPNRSADLIKTYGDFWGVKDIFDTVGSGITTDRDSLVIDFDKKNLIDKMKIAVSGNYDTDFKKMYDIKNSSSYKFEDRLKLENFDEKNILDINYRPFDIRKIYYRIGFTSRPAEEVTQHFINKDNLAFGFSRQLVSNSWHHCFVTNNIAERCFVSLQSRETTYITPLHLYPKKDSLSTDINTNFTDNFNSFIKENYSDKSPEEIFSYIYAVLFSPSYRKKYNDLLKFDFPRVPFNCKKEIFEKLSEIGQTLIDLHLLKSNPTNNKATFDVDDPDKIVSKVEYKSGKIYFNETTYFGGVTEEVWNYYFGGYQVLKSWLDYRRKVNYKLKNEDLKHFLNLINLIYDTIDIQKKIDTLTKDWI
jgi:predicted helicase